MRNPSKNADHFREWLEKGVILVDGEMDFLDLNDPTPVHVAIAVIVEGYGPHHGAIFINQNRFHSHPNIALQNAVEILEEWLLEHRADELRELEEEYGEEALDVFHENIDALTWTLPAREVANAIKGTDAAKFIEVENDGAEGKLEQLGAILETAYDHTANAYVGVPITAKNKAKKILARNVERAYNWREYDEQADQMTEREAASVDDQIRKLERRISKIVGRL